jgi:hypothetical protein
MNNQMRVSTSLCLGAALLVSGCGEGDDGGMGADGIIGDAGDLDVGDTTSNMDAGDADADAGDGDGDGSDADAGDGDGDPTGDPPECDGTSPYMGGWDIGCCQDDVDPQNGWSPGGVHVGTIMPDWTFTDQFGDALRLYDFCHDAVWFEYVALW